jgi:hypothetical protein
MEKFFTAPIQEEEREWAAREVAEARAFWAEVATRAEEARKAEARQIAEAMVATAIVAAEERARAVEAVMAAAAEARAARAAALHVPAPIAPLEGSTVSVVKFLLDYFPNFLFFSLLDFSLL